MVSLFGQKLQPPPLQQQQVEELEVGRTVEDVAQGLQDAFDTFDADKSGSLDEHEVMAILTRTSTGTAMTEADAAEFIALFDRNKDHKLQINECELDPSFPYPGPACM
jgi:Ca2+-binding EF-hand superfamily protein